MFSIPDFVPGVNYSLTVSGIDVDEQTDTEVVEFTLAGKDQSILFWCTCILCSIELQGPDRTACMHGPAWALQLLLSFNYDL